jgi:hypothetical protein
MNDSEWSAFCESVLEVQRSDFRKEMEDRLRKLGSKSSMGIFDSAVLMTLVRKLPLRFVLKQVVTSECHRHLSSKGCTRQG